MKQFQILYKEDGGFLDNLKEIKQWRASHSAYVTIFRIYSEDMNLEHIQHICDCLDNEMPDALYLGCTTNANIMNGVLSDVKIILTCTIFEYETTQARILQFPFFEENAVQDVLELKKTHPCGSRTWLVLRVGMDFKLRCQGCGHELMIPRSKAEKSVKKVIQPADSQ